MKHNYPKDYIDFYKKLGIDLENGEKPNCLDTAMYFYFKEKKSNTPCT